MTSTSEVLKDDKGWTVNVYYGATRYTYGPYRFKFFARFIAWTWGNEH